MKYILSHPRLTKSAKPLARRISELIGEEVIVSKIPLKAHKLVVRYGNSALPNTECNYNDADYIGFAGNKLALSILLAKKEYNIKHVELGNTHALADDFPICVRKELNRGGGIGIEIYENEEDYITDFNDWMNPYFWSKWYNFQFELGVHILGGEIVKVFKKVREEGLDDEKYPIRNTQRGYKFKLKPNWRENYTGLAKFVAELYKVFPIQFARLDIGYDKETGGYRLIEINSAPDLSQNKNTLEIYAKFLAEKIGE